MRRLMTMMTAGLLVAAILAPTVTGTEPVATGRHLVPGAPLLGGSWGMTFDAQDNLWVGHIGARNVTKHDPDSGKLLATFGPDRGFEGADDVAAAPDGSVYYTAILTGEVGRINPDGTHTMVVNLGVGVNPVTVTPDGRVFVGKAVMGDGLWEIYPDTATAPRLINPSPGINAFDWWDGYLYAPQPANGTVVRIDPDVDGGDITTIVTGLVSPTSVDIAPDGTMYVAESDGQRVLRFDPQTGATVAVATFGGDNMAIDSRGRIFVSGGNDGAIYRVLPNGRPLVISAPGINASSGIAVLPTAEGREIVYSMEKFLVNAFDGRTGQQVLQAPGWTMPDTASPDGDRLILSGLFTGVVAIWDPATDAVGPVYAEKSPGVPYFLAPSNAIRFDGDLIVGELGAARVTRFDQGTETSSSWDGIFVPTGLAATDDALYAADWAAGVVYQLLPGGAKLPVVTGLEGPEGLAVMADGNLVVVEATARRLSLIDLGGTTPTVKTLATGLDVGQPAPTGFQPFWSFDGVAVGPSGAIYVSANGIDRYELH